MSTAVAAPPSSTALSLSRSSPKDRSSASPLRYAPRLHPLTTMSHRTDTVPVSASPNLRSATTIATPAVAPPARLSPQTVGSPVSNDKSPPSRPVSADKASPNSLKAPIIRVKKEPSSPQMSNTRPRPRRLDLSTSASSSRGPQTAGPNPSAPLPSKESAGLAIKDLGVACLSPGFQTHDPTLRTQLQRSLSVREQQRQLIEARQKGSTKPLTANDSPDLNQRIADGPATSRRKGPPPGLSINAPPAASFAHERVIQSAPLHQSFTGLRQANPHGPSGLGQSSHPYHMHNPQTAHRLPPISDVFAAERMDAPSTSSFRPAGPSAHPSPSHPPPMQSPGLAPNHHQNQPMSAGTREFRSAEEAVQGMSGGRDELLPKIVHYGGAQPPTPPSPGGHHPGHHHHHHQQSHEQYSSYHQQHSSHAHPPPSAHYDHRPDLARTNSISAAGRRRTRDEYERDNISPAVYPGEFKRRPSARDREEDDWRQGMGSRDKREEFLRLCERAWDLFHS